MRKLLIVLLLLLGIGGALGVFLPCQTQERYVLAAVVLNTFLILCFLIYYSDCSTFTVFTAISVFLGYNLVLLTIFMFSVDLASSFASMNSNDL